MNIQFAVCLLVFVSVLLIAPGVCLDPFFTAKTAWVALLGTAVAASWLLGIARGERSLPRLGIECPLAAVVLASFVSILPVAWPTPQFLDLALLVLHLLLLFAFASMWTRAGSLPRYNPLDWALGAAAIMSLYVIFQSYGLDPFHWQGGVPDWRGELTGTLGGPNFVAGFAAVILPWGVYRFLSSPGRSSIPALAALVLITAVLFVTFSVGAWTGLAAAGLLAALAGLLGIRKKKAQSSDRKPIIRIVLLISVTVVVAGFYMLDNPWNNVGRSLIREAIDSPRWLTGHAARRFIWKTTALMVEDRPLLGIGFDNYYRVHQEYQGNLYLARGLPHDRPTVSLVPQVHNEYYQHLAETGFLGFAALAWFLVAAVCVMRKRWKETAPSGRPALLAVFAGLSVGAVHALSSFPLRVPPTALLLTLLLAYALAPRSEDRLRAFSPTRARYVLPAAFLVLLAALYAGVGPAVASAFMQGSPGARPPDDLLLADRAARVWPFSQQTNDFAARTAAKHGNYEDALEWSEKALRYRDSFLTRKLRRDIFLAVGDLPAAVKEGDLMLRLNPMYPPLVLEQAQLRKQAGLPYSDLLDRAETLLRSLVKEGKTDEARRLGDYIVRIDPERAERLREIGPETGSG